MTLLLIVDQDPEFNNLSFVAVRCKAFASVGVTDRLPNPPVDLAPTVVTNRCVSTFHSTVLF